MPLLIQIPADDLREFLAVPVAADGSRGPLTILHPTSLIEHLSGLIRRLLWGLGMTETNAAAGATFGFPVEVHMACQMTQAFRDDCMSVLEAIAKHAPIDVTRLVPIYPPPAYAVQVIGELRVLAQSTSESACRRLDEHDRTRIALLDVMREHDLIPLRPLRPSEQARLIGDRFTTMRAEIEQLRSLVEPR